MTHTTDEELDALVDVTGFRGSSEQLMNALNETLRREPRQMQGAILRAAISEITSLRDQLADEHRFKERIIAEASDAIEAIGKRCDAANARADRAEAALAAQIEADALEPIAWAYSHAAGGYTVCDDEYQAWREAGDIGREMTVRPLYFIRKQPHSRSALDRLIADAEAKALRMAAAKIRPSLQSSGNGVVIAALHREADAIEAMIPKEGEA